MKKHELVTDFSEMVDEIERDQILLPDFQRGFKWTTKEMQGKLAASVLCKMPLGSVLLLDLPGKEYAARRIGSSEQETPIILETDEERQFLLDGQQRITVMVNLFSNLIHEGGVTRLDSLKRRAFLGIAKPTQQEKYEQDFWGLRWLYFPLSSPEEDFPHFLTEDIVDTIFLEEFTKSHPTPYSPYCECEAEELISFCVSDKEYYLIPLYLLTRRRDDRIQRKNSRLLQKIIQEIAQKQGLRLEQEFEDLQTIAEKRIWLQKFLKTENSNENDIELMLEDKEALLECLFERQEDWKNSMKSYLYSCLKINLHVMDVPNSSREKAIEIFENMNRGGVKLSTFDLVMARGARDNQYFRRTLEQECEREGNYLVEYVPERIRKYCADYVAQKQKLRSKYNALSDMKCIESNGEYSKIFQDTFLNVLSLKCHDEKIGDIEVNDVGTGKLRNYREEMSRENILNLTSEEINSNYAVCCRAMDHAAFFLKARCGMRSIAEVNYRLMYTVLSYLFVKEDNYNRKEVWDLLTAWYWCVIFSGCYNQDQNTQACRDITFLSQIIQENKDVSGYIKGLQERAWKASNFSDKEFLLYRRSDTGNYPKEILGDYICQFYLAEGYEDVLPVEGQEQVRLCSFTEDMVGPFEKHHIIPKMSFQNMREERNWSKSTEGRKNIVNSPLNMVFISSKANKRIAACNLASYIQYTQSSSVYNLDFPQFQLEQEDDNIDILLEQRFKLLEGKLNDRVNCWMTEWR